MAAVTLPDLMTTEAFLTLPSDGMDRWLIQGEVREKPRTVPNRFHSKIMVNASTALKIWRDAQPEPRGEVLCGEAGVRLARDPDTTVGIDVVYVSAEVVARQTDETTLIDGVSVLAIEILSPSDTIDEINEKIDTYQGAGVPLVWVIDPHRRTVTIYRLGVEPELVNVLEELSGEPDLPGFRLAVAGLFA